MNRENRNIKITVRFTPKEFEEINAQFRKSTCREMSDYFRSVLLQRKLTLNYGNQSRDDLIKEFKLLRRGLNAIGNNFNQAVKKLNGCQQHHDIIYWTHIISSHQKTILEKLDSIKARIGEISDL